MGVKRSSKFQVPSLQIKTKNQNSEVLIFDLELGTWNLELETLNLFPRQQFA